MGSRPSIVLGVSLALVGMAATILAAALAVHELRSGSKSSTGFKPSVAQRFDVDYVLADDGSLEVVENVVYDFRSPRGLLTRHFGYAMPKETLPVDIEATRDGKPETVAWLPEGWGGHRLEIGSAKLQLTGVHRYRLSYRIPDALGDDPSEFVRQLISTGYQVRIEQSRLTLRLPAAATQVDCTVGLTDPCELTGEGTRDLVITAGPMPRNTGVTIRAVMSAPAG